MSKRTESVEGVIYRNMTVTRDVIVDEEKRIVDISFSSELPVRRASFWSDPWMETLGHKRTEADLSLLNDGATLHYNHSRERNDRIGVVLSAKIKDKRGTARVQFSRNERVNDVWDDVKDNILRNVSVGYEINERVLTRQGKDGEPDEYRVTKWRPRELSFVDIPADPSVGLGRSVEMAGDTLIFPGMPGINENYRINEVQPPFKEEHVMGDKTRDNNANPGNEGENADNNVRSTPDNLNVVDLDKERSTAQATGTEQGIQAENQRQADIREAFKPFASRVKDFDKFQERFLSDPKQTVEDARAAMLAEIGKDQEPVEGSQVRIEVNQDSSQVRQAISDAILVRSNIVRAHTEEGKKMDKTFRGYTMFELARYMVEMGGKSTAGLSKMEVCARAFTSSDFPLILADIANKSLLKGYEEAPETWNVWAQIGNLSDFKENSRVNLSSFDNLELVAEHGEFKYGQYGENGENIRLGTYGKLFKISRQALINDDLDVFTRIPAGMGRAASRLVGDLAYGVLTANPLLSDGNAFFSAPHNNDITSGGPPSVAEVVKMRVGMGTQTDSSNSARGLNIRPAYLICPLALEDTARVVQTSETDPSQGNSRVPNTVANTFETVSDPRLDADSAVKWYMASGQEFDTVEVAFLDGNQNPTLEQQQGWSIDGTEFKVRQDVAAAPMDFRTWQRNAGA